VQINGNSISCRLYVSMDEVARILATRDPVHDLDMIDTVEMFFEVTGNESPQSASAKNAQTLLRYRVGGRAEQCTLDYLYLGMNGTTATDTSTETKLSLTEIAGKRALMAYTFSRYFINVDDALETEQQKKLQMRVSLDVITSDPGYAVCCTKVRIEEEAEREAVLTIVGRVAKWLTNHFTLATCPGYSKLMYMMRIFDEEAYVRQLMLHDPIHTAVFEYIKMHESCNNEDWMKQFMFDALMPAEQYNSGNFEDWIKERNHRQHFMGSKHLAFGAPDESDFFYEYY
jgi:hypothetical protein